MDKFLEQLDVMEMTITAESETSNLGTAKDLCDEITANFNEFVDDNVDELSFVHEESINLFQAEYYNLKIQVWYGLDSL